MLSWDKDKEMQSWWWYAVSRHRLNICCATTYSANFFLSPDLDINPFFSHKSQKPPSASVKTFLQIRWFCNVWLYKLYSGEALFHVPAGGAIGRLIRVQSLCLSVLSLSVFPATVRLQSSPWSRWTTAPPTLTSSWCAAVNRVRAPVTSCGNVSDRIWANCSGGPEPPTGSTPGEHSFWRFHVEFLRRISRMCAK